MYHSDHIINKAQLADLDRAFEPKRRPFGRPGYGAVRTVIAVAATFAAASFVVYSTGLVI